MQAGQDFPYYDLPDVPRLSLEYFLPSRLRSKAELGDLTPDEEKLDQRLISFVIDGIRDLRKDHVGGATDLATRALEIQIEASEYAAEYKIATPSDTNRRHVRNWWDFSRRIGYVICTYGRPSMDAVITSVISRTLSRSYLGIRDREDGSKGAGSYIISECLSLMHRALQDRHDNIQSKKIAEHFREYLTSTRDQADGDTLKILTLGSSSTVADALLAGLDTKRFKYDMRIMESRPLCEGATLATKMVEAIERTDIPRENLEITIASDSSVMELAQEVDFVILGANRISHNGDVSNKMGSLPAAALAKTVTQGRARVVVLSGVEKVTKPQAMQDYFIEDNGSYELVSTWSDSNGKIPDKPNVLVKNAYFEWVPAEYVDDYVCENGTLKKEDIKKASDVVANCEDEVFHGLHPGKIIPSLGQDQRQKSAPNSDNSRSGSSRGNCRQLETGNSLDSVTAGNLEDDDVPANRTSVSITHADV